MWDILGQAFSWLLLIFFGGQALIFVGLVLWTIWIDAIKPRLIPAADIDRVAADIVANYPDPEGEAFARHERVVRQRRRGADLLVPSAEGRAEAYEAATEPNRIAFTHAKQRRDA